MDTSIKRMMELAGVDITQGKARQLIENVSDDMLQEGVFTDFLKKLFKKKEEDKLTPLTDEDRALIKKHFKNTNADVKLGKDYVLTHNVHGSHGKGLIAFYKENGSIKAGIAYHSSKSDVGNPKAMPLAHIVKPANSDAEMEAIKKMLD